MTIVTIVTIVMVGAPALLGGRGGCGETRLGSVYLGGSGGCWGELRWSQGRVLLTMSLFVVREEGGGNCERLRVSGHSLSW